MLILDSGLPAGVHHPPAGHADQHQPGADRVRRAAGRRRQRAGELRGPAEPGRALGRGEAEGPGQGRHRAATFVSVSAEQTRERRRRDTHLSLALRRFPFISGKEGAASTVESEKERKERLSLQIPRRQRRERPDRVRGLHVRLRAEAVPQGVAVQPRVPLQVRRQVAQGKITTID